jgi:hypothetical protein
MFTQGEFMPRMFLPLLIAAVLIKICLLFIALPAIETRYPDEYQMRNAPDKYAAIAANVAAGNGYRASPETAPTMTREPGFVLFLALLFVTAGQSLWVVNAANVLLSLVTVLLIIKVGKEIELPPLAIWTAPFFYLLHPAILVSESRAGFEIFFITLVMASLYFLIRLKKTGMVYYAIPCGIFLGYGSITRGTFLIFGLLSMIFLLLSSRYRTKETMVNIGVLFIIFSLPITAWAVRNWHISGEVVLTNTVVGDVLYQGLHVELNDKNRDYHLIYSEASAVQSKVNIELGIPYKRGFFEEYYDPRDEIRHSKAMKEIVFSTYMETPTLLLKAMTNNFFRLWFLGRTQKATLLNIVIMTPLLLLAVYGMGLAIRDRRPVGLILLFTATLILAHLPVIALARHHVPLIPAFALFQGAAVAGILGLRKQVSPATLLESPVQTCSWDMEEGLVQPRADRKIHSPVSSARVE